ncbi:retrovirus-related pol polyprotein from transposon TNT 1-94 [Tanacetum coccineum]
MDDLIRDRNAKLAAFQQEIDTLKETLSNNVKEKESLSKTLTMYRSTQAMHMLTKPHVFYDDTHKQVLGYQNPFHLKKAQRIQPTLYDGSVIAKEHVVISMIDDEETLIGKLSAEQAFLLKHSSFSKTPFKSHTPIRIEAPSELPKVSFVNESRKKLKYQLANFDKVVKKRLTSDAITAGSWGFEHTKECFVTEIIPFLKVLKGTFNAFDKTLLDEITKVQTVFNQMEAAVDQCSVDKNVFEIQIKQLRIDNDQLLNQIMSQEIMHIVVNSVDILDVKKSCVYDCSKCLEIYKFRKLFKFRKALHLKKHCISLELATQLNQEIFQRENSGENLNAPTFNQLFEINELKAQSQEKDTVIRKLKERIKSLSGKDSVENVKKDIDEIETINIELEHSVAKLLSENENLRKEREHLKSIYKDQFDSIRKTRVQSKEHCDSLIAQINAKSVENSDLNAQLQEKVFAITALKNELRKLKGKNVVNTAVSKPNATIALGMFKLDIEPISPRLKNNRDAHEELLVYVSQTCPNSPKPSEKLVDVTPMNKDKRVRFAEPVTSSSNIPKQTDSLKTKYSNKPLLTSTGVKPTTSASGSKPSGNTKNNRITRPPSRLDRPLNLEGVDLLLRSRDTNLYTISLDNMLKISLIYLLSKASKTKSWLWHRRLSHLNFGKSKKSSHQPKAKDTNQEKLYLLHMYLCGLMRVESINRKNYILVIIDDYSQFIWVKFLRSKDEAPDAIIKCIKNIQVHLNDTVRNVRTDNETEFVNQTLRDFYENFSISHQTLVARIPQQNGVVKRQNRTLVEAARTMLIFSKAPLLLWAKAINTACYTQNRSLIRL